MLNLVFVTLITLCYNVLKRGGENRIKIMKLIHLTYRANVCSILENGFKISYHTPEKNKIMWLGDGVYFYNCNDKNALKQGVSMLRNKKDRPSPPLGEITQLSVELNVDKDNVFNLLDEHDVSFMIEYLKAKSDFYAKSANYTLKEDLKLLKFVIKHINEFRPFNNDKYGVKLGYFINEFLEEVQAVRIDIVACAFITSEKFDSDKSKAIEQYCLRNISLITEMLHEKDVSFF